MTVESIERELQEQVAGRIRLAAEGPDRFRVAPSESNAWAAASSRAVSAAGVGTSRTVVRGCWQSSSGEFESSTPIRGLGVLGGRRPASWRETISDMATLDPATAASAKSRDGPARPPAVGSAA